MKNFIVEAPMSGWGVYHVRAENAEEAMEKLSKWTGSEDDVEFSHYSEEWPDEDVQNMKCKES